MTSIVRRNLLTQYGYTPYCGSDHCTWRWPRTTFNGAQFACRCGWKSGFEATFIAQYISNQDAMKADQLTNQ